MVLNTLKNLTNSENMVSRVSILETIQSFQNQQLNSQIFKNKQTVSLPKSNSENQLKRTKTPLLNLSAISTHTEQPSLKKNPHPSQVDLTKSKEIFVPQISLRDSLSILSETDRDVSMFDYDREVHNTDILKVQYEKFVSHLQEITNSLGLTNNSFITRLLSKMTDFTSQFDKMSKYIKKRTVFFEGLSNDYYNLKAESEQTIAHLKQELQEQVNEASSMEDALYKAQAELKMTRKSSGALRQEQKELVDAQKAVLEYSTENGKLVKEKKFLQDLLKKKDKELFRLREELKDLTSKAMKAMDSSEAKNGDQDLDLLSLDLNLTQDPQQSTFDNPVLPQNQSVVSLGADDDKKLLKVLDVDKKIVEELRKDLGTEREYVRALRIEIEDLKQKCEDLEAEKLLVGERDGLFFQSQLGDDHESDPLNMSQLSNQDGLQDLVFSMNKGLRLNEEKTTQTDGNSSVGGFPEGMKQGGAAGGPLGENLQSLEHLFKKNKKQAVDNVLTTQESSGGVSSVDNYQLIDLTGPDSGSSAQNHAPLIQEPLRSAQATLEHSTRLRHRAAEKEKIGESPSSEDLPDGLEEDKKYLGKDFSISTEEFNAFMSNPTFGAKEKKKERKKAPKRPEIPPIDTRLATTETAPKAALDEEGQGQGPEVNLRKAISKFTHFANPKFW